MLSQFPVLLQFHLSYSKSLLLKFLLQSMPYVHDSVNKFFYKGPRRGEIPKYGTVSGIHKTHGKGEGNSSEAGI